MIDLTGRTAIVTGGSRGIGAATARLLARAGASVGIGYRSRAADAEAVVAELQSLGVRAWAEPGDLSVRSDADRLFERADREFGGLDLFVANAAIWRWAACATVGQWSSSAPPPVSGARPST